MDPWTTDSRTFRTFLLVSQIEPDAIRDRIRQARREAGLTQQELADLIETHKRTVENYENVRVPEWTQLGKIARVLNRPIEWFLHGDDRSGSADLAEVLARLDQIDEKLEILLSRTAVRLDPAAEARAAAEAAREAVARSGHGSSSRRGSRTG